MFALIVSKISSVSVIAQKPQKIPKNVDYFEFKASSGFSMISSHYSDTDLSFEAIGYIQFFFQKIDLQNQIKNQNFTFVWKILPA